MSEARELKEKLEQVQAELRQVKAEIDKQRAQHAREQKPLQKALQEARREAERLRARIAKARERGRAARVVLPAPVVPAGAVPHVLVGLGRLPASQQEALPSLSRLLKLSPVDVRLRLALPAPSLLARLPGPEAEELVKALRAEGFGVTSGELSRLEELMKVRRFTLDAEALAVENAKGEVQELPYTALRLLVRGRRKTTSVETKEEVEYHGPRQRYAVKRQVDVKTDHLEHFLWVYGDGLRAAFDMGTNFAGLGEKRGLTKTSAIQALLNELRERAPRAVVDERFLQAPRLSLPLVGPERSHEVLAGLTYEALQEGLWP